MDLDGLLYIGGIGAPFAPLTVPPVLWTGSLRLGYVGCMRDLVINGSPIDIAGYAQQQDSGKRIFYHLVCVLGSAFLVDVQSIIIHGSIRYLTSVKKN